MKTRCLKCAQNVPKMAQMLSGLGKRAKLLHLLAKSWKERRVTADIPSASLWFRCPVMEREGKKAIGKEGRDYIREWDKGIEIKKGLPWIVDIKWKLSDM